MGRLSWALVLVGVGLSAQSAVLVPHALSATQSFAVALSQSIRSAVDGARLGGPRSHAELVSLYGGLGFAPLWLDDAGRPTSEATEAVKLLAGAGLEGLQPEDYAAASLADQASALRARATADPVASASWDVQLSRNVLRYLRELHTGRIDPQALGFRLASRTDEHDYVAALREAVSTHRLLDVAASFAPPHSSYRELRNALATYRTLAADRSLVLPPAPPRSVHPGEPYDGLSALARMLVALGDMAPGTRPTADGLYQGDIVAGVKRFQERHGLEPDGVLGQQTVAALRKPLGDRVRQIELSLERLRWLPDFADRPLVGVNVPMFRLWTWPSPGQHAVPETSMRVIVGRAHLSQTPVFVEQIESVIFRPFWNVPTSIARAELLPELRRNPAVLDRQSMDIVSGPGDHAAVVPMSPEALDRLARGELRLRQRPGPQNALGLVKFIFPNQDDVYMHATPAQRLFGRARRDFSHGCIRVEDPIGLAEWLLEGQGWTRAQIVEAMEGPATRTVLLERPVQVVLFYITALVGPGDARVHFVEDIYKHDRTLERALAARRDR